MYESIDEARKRHAIMQSHHLEAVWTELVLVLDVAVLIDRHVISCPYGLQRNWDLKHLLQLLPQEDVSGALFRAI